MGGGVDLLFNVGCEGWQLHQVAIWVCHCLFPEFEHKVGVEFHEELLPEHVVVVADRWIN